MRDHATVSLETYVPRAALLSLPRFMPCARDAMPLPHAGRGGGVRVNVRVRADARRIVMRIPSGRICRVVPYAVIPAWLAPLLLPYCRPMIRLLSANCSCVNSRGFSSATFTPIWGPRNPFFCAYFHAHPSVTMNVFQTNIETGMTHHPSEGVDAIHHLIQT